LVRWQIINGRVITEGLGWAFWIYCTFHVFTLGDFGVVRGFLSFPVCVIALTKLDISYAYPLTSLSFVSVVFMGWFFFGETLSIAPVRELWLPKKAGQ